MVSGRHWLKCFLFVMSGLLVMLGLTGCEMHFGVLNPKGIIAYEERKLLFDSLALMLIVVLPVIVMSLAFVYHYQVSHRVKDYKPNWSHNVFLEAVWWGIPCTIIVILAILTWKETYALDPYRNITLTREKPLSIDVIALPWKWLFIYPEQHIATINYLEIPVGRQVVFNMTADNTPMSAFFIPQLGGQIYVMAGMTTQLHLLADELGTYEGLNSQFSGEGFSEMHFATNVVNAQTMQAWVEHVKQSATPLTNAQYQQLLRPSIGDKPLFFTNPPANLLKQVALVYQNTYGPVHPRGRGQQ